MSASPRRLDEPFEVSGATFHVGASIGIALYPEHGLDAETLFKRADSAMYQAKRSGGGNVAFYESEGGDARQRLSLTTRLRRAIGEGELRLHYQPIWSIGGSGRSRIEGLEALVRWQDPDVGLIPPGDFIPVAEETGLIDGIGDWVVDALCAQAGEWAQAGFRPQLAFNLSVATAATARPGGGDRREDRRRRARRRAVLCRAHRDRGDVATPVAIGRCSPNCARPDFRSQSMTSAAATRRCRACSDLPAQVLKIDRSFLERVPADEEATAIVAAMLGLGQALGMTTVVEGVETMEQLVFLRENGSPLVQGFLLGRPVPADQITPRTAAVGA